MVSLRDLAQCPVSEAENTVVIKETFRTDRERTDYIESTA